MTVIINGTTGITSVNGSAAAPSVTGTDTDTGIVYGTNTVSIATGGTERLQVDSSGNVGVGVTPSAWATVVPAIELKNGVHFASLGTSAPIGYLGANTYYNGTNWIYKNSSQYATRYETNSNGAGAHAWFTAPNSGGSGAGTTATFTQAMTLDASGNLGVGTTSPSVRLHAKTGSSGALSDSRYIVTAEGGSEAYLCASASAYAGIRFPNASSASQAYIDYTHSTNYMTFGVNNGERMRIDSSGNLLVGATSTQTIASRLTLTYAGGTRWGVGPTSGSGNFIVKNDSDQGVYISSGSTSWSAYSDERVKDIIEPITDATTKVLTLRAVIGKYKTDEEGTRRSFLIAQDVQAVLPEAVDATEAEKLGVRYTEVIPLLVAAIKEQQAIIETLKARLDAANL